MPVPLCRRRSAWFCLTPGLLTLTILATTLHAQPQTGTIGGVVTDAQRGALPGATVTLTGKQGSIVGVTDDRGAYRFVGLDPGVYEVTAELESFVPRMERDLRVGLGTTLVVNFTLEIGGLTETVEVMATSSAIDATSTSTETTLSQSLLSNMPINLGNFNAVNTINVAPGINGSQAFGGDPSANAVLIDGVDTRDPIGGGAWVFYNYNIVEEVQVGGLGAPAEYGGFSGAVVNTITKSGGNRYSGLFEFRYTNDSLAGDNLSEEALSLNPTLSAANLLTSFTDYTVQLSGPISRDRAFYWVGAQRFAFEQDPAGPRTKQTEVSPRFNGKVTVNLSPRDTLIGSGQFDTYNVTGAGGLFFTDRQTWQRDSPEAVYNVQYRRVFSPETLLEAKFSGWWAYIYNDPIDPAPLHYDVSTGRITGGAGSRYYLDPGRNQLNVTFSRYAEAFGTHSLKFGVEIERSRVRSRNVYSDCGPVPCYYIDYSGVPTYAYNAPAGYMYDIEGRNKRESYYAQDAWKMGRLTANLGLRLDHIRGYSPKLEKDVYAPALSWGPRLGVVFDLSGRGTSIVKGSWSRYTDGVAFTPYLNSVGGIEDFITYGVLPNGSLLEIDRVPAFDYGIESGIDHMGLDEVTLSWDQQIRRDVRVGATGIWRDYRDFVSSVLPRATWTPFAYKNELTGQPMTLYRWANRPQTERDYLMTNIAGFRYRDPSGQVLGDTNAKRTYRGLMLTLSKTYSRRWQAQASYVWSEARGTVENGGRTGLGGGITFQNPTLALVNADGFMPSDHTHELKLLAGYQVPRVEVSVNAVVRSISGTTYVPFAVVGGRTLNWTGSLNVRLGPRGAERLATQNTLNLRIEKVFKVDVHRIGLFVDIANALNDDGVSARQTRYPDRTISIPDENGAAQDYVVPYNAPTALVPARQFTLGARWSF